MATAAARVRERWAGLHRQVLAARRLVLVVIATSAVTLLPVAGARGFGSATGIESIFASLGVGVLLSMAISSLGARVWSSLAISEDIVFGELMLWGWIRRLHSVRRLERATHLLGLDGKGWAPGSELTPEEQARVLQDLAVALERRDLYTHGHTNRVTRYSYAIARGMGLDPVTVENIRVAASVHDVGKMNIPLEILNKPGALTDAEFDAIKEHAAIGADMVTRLGSPEITEMVRHHHERLDGRGYPDRLAGEDIPLGARIIAVADTFDAICSTRSYRKASKHKTALAILKKESGTQLDRAAVEAFISYYSGRGTFEWRAMVTTVPQRGFEWLGRSVPGGVAQGVATAAAALTIAASPLSLVPDVIRLHNVSAVHVKNSSMSRADVAPESGGGAASNSDSGGPTSGDGITGAPRDSVIDPLPGDDTGSDVPVTDPAAEPSPGEGSSNAPIADPVRGSVPVDVPGDGITDPVDDVTDPIQDVTDPVGDPIKDVTDPVTDPIDDVTDPVTDPIDNVTDPVDDVTEPVDDVLEPVKDVTEPVIDLPGPLLDSWDARTR